MKTRKTVVTGRRFRFIDVPYTKAERRRLMQERIREAQEWKAPYTHAELEEIPRGQPDPPDGLVLKETLTWL